LHQTSFEVRRPGDEVEVGGRPGVVPTIGGQAWIYGFSNYVLDPTDPFANGFTVGDLWA